MELVMANGVNVCGFEELNEYEMMWVDGGGVWDVVKDAAVGALGGAVAGFGKGFVVGALVGVFAGPGGVLAGAVSCGLYYAGKGAVAGAALNVVFQDAAGYVKEKWFD